MKQSITKQITASLGVFAALAIGGAAHAQSGTVTWRGNVDSVARITFRGQNVNAFALSGKSPSNVSVRRSGDTSLSGRNVSLQDIQGRGSVEIVQSPSRSNNYTTIVEVRDPDPGDAQYQFRLRSNDSSNGRNDDRRDDRDDNDRRGNGRWGDNRRNDRDDRGNGRGSDNRRDTSLPNDPALRVAYLLGVQQGKKDSNQRLSRDYSRYRNRYNDRTEADFRRGYENGFYGADNPRDHN